jgi:hypothetical protein
MKSEIRKTTTKPALFMNPHVIMLWRVAAKVIRVTTNQIISNI